ncbi:molybdate ABC transporter ATP-binding protein ModF [Alteromonadaceae bacterium BrNp21-10]|nr:molybdate ABC transporter ATP-binding protein ModF [Alteromonadaceae bacterium BrNp21-10]
MTQVQLQNVSALFNQHFWLHDINWQIQAGQHWAIVGANGAGKSALASLLMTDLSQYNIELQAGDIQNAIASSRLVSSDALQALMALERQKDAADILDVIPVPTTAREMLLIDDNGDTIEAALDQPYLDELIQLLNFEQLIDRAFIELSTGETVKLLLIRALLFRPSLLILDEPFDGLDSASSGKLRDFLGQLSQQTTVIMVLNRFDEIPEFISHFAYLQQGQLTLQVARNDVSQFEQLYKLLHLQSADLSLPPPEQNNSSRQPPTLDPSQPLVHLRNVAVRYGDNCVFENLNWQINAGEHWQLSGPNGSGKTCLLNLITGDHPQCYSNDIFVFGFQRGSGESIWQIKQYIGFISNTLHLQYRVNCTLRQTIISGFYDSIGLYDSPSKEQVAIADKWLALLGLGQLANQRFQQLSFGDQRLILIARAMVKHPTLLIMDEPCLGLDDINRQRVLALLDHICTAENTTVLYVNHHAEDKISAINKHLDMLDYRPL